MNVFILVLLSFPDLFLDIVDRHLHNFHNLHNLFHNHTHSIHTPHQNHLNKLVFFKSLKICKRRKIVLFKSLKSCKRRNKGNFMLKSNSNKILLCGGGEQHYLVLSKLST